MASKITHVFSASMLCLTLLISTETAAQVITSGSACHSITPSQATKFEWRAEGIKNEDSRNNWWVNCPFQRPPGRSELNLSLRVFNSSNRTIEFECNFREMYEGRRLQGKPIGASISGGRSQTLTWTMQPENAVSVTNAACRLPAGLQIEGSFAQFSERCSNQDLYGAWIVTAGEGYDGFEMYAVAFDPYGGLEYVGVDSNYDEQIEGEGTYDFDQDSCFLEATLESNVSSDVLVFGYMSENKQTIPGISINGNYFGGGTMSKYKSPATVSTPTAFVDHSQEIGFVSEGNLSGSSNGQDFAKPKETLQGLRETVKKFRGR